MNNLIMLIGNIGSGKTTLAKNFVNQGYIAVSRDWLRYGIGEGKYTFNIELEPVIFKTEWCLFSNLIYLGKDILLDEINISKRMRHKYILLAKEYGYNITAFLMPKLTQAESVKRRLGDNHGTGKKSQWKKVWSNFNKYYEAPTKEEGFDKIIQWVEDARHLKVANEKD